jgi:hypothetical protein
MVALVDHGHSKDLEMGFYLNGCMCGEPFPWSPSPPGQERVADYGGALEYLSALNFDAVKIDFCGAQRNMTRYARLMQATQQNFTIEDCHWGQCSEDDDSSCPTSSWCPFNLFRSSTDINTGKIAMLSRFVALFRLANLKSITIAGAFGWWRNLQSMTRFQDRTAPLSRPGCWAYPDMLEVGRVMGGDYHWNRAHFGAWCVTSSPLVLGLDITNSTILGPVVDIVTNPEAIKINQEWAGHPGALVWSEGTQAGLGYPAARDCDLSNTSLHQGGWSTQPVPAAGLTAVLITSPLEAVVGASGSGCLTMEAHGWSGGVGTNVRLAITPCNASSNAQLFAHNNATGIITAPFAAPVTGSTLCVAIEGSGPIVYASYNSCGDRLHNAFTLHAGGNRTMEGDAGGNQTKCLGVEQTDPAQTYQDHFWRGTDENQCWAKPLSDGVAVLLINPNPVPSEFAVPLANLTSFPSATATPALGMGVATTVRDVWARKALPSLAAGERTLRMTVGPLDSAFLKLGPLPDASGSALSSCAPQSCAKATTIRVGGVGATCVSIQAALECIPIRTATAPRVTVLVAPGVYHNQSLRVRRSKGEISLVGDSPDPAAVVVLGLGANGGMCGGGDATVECGALAVEGDDFVLANITLANAANPSTMVPTIPAGKPFAIEVGGDRAAVYNSRLLGKDDSVFTGPRRVYFRNTTISGSTDFNFGQGAAVYDRCTLVAQPGRFWSWITAHSGTTPNGSTPRTA